MSKSAEQKVYEFDEFRFDAEHLMLYRRGEPIPLAPKAAETLLTFIEHNGEILSKDKLIELIWPDSFVEESNLFLYLSVLRKTLGEKENGEPYLETLRRRGYRFSGDVRLAGGNSGNGVRVSETTLAPPQARRLENVPASGPETVDPIPDNRLIDGLKRRRLHAAASLIGVIAAVSLGFSYFFSPRPIRSIAVIPVENSNAELEYLSDGMTFGLTESLLKVPELDVKASSTVFRHKGTDRDPASIGKALNVEAVLAPRLIQRGDDVTLYVELVDSRTENSLWQRSYSRTVAQLGMLERDIIRDLVNELGIDVTNMTRQKIARNYTDSPEAAELFLRGRFLIRKLSEPSIREGLRHLQRATEYDSSFAPAYAMIATGLRSLTLCCDAHPSEMLESKRAATRAIELNEDLAEAHSSLAASLYHYDWNFAEAEKHYLRALELDPNSAISHFLYADFLGRMDRVDEANARRQRAVELEPYSPYFNAFALNSSDPKTGLERIRFTIDLDPNFYFSHFMSGGVFERMKMYPEAEAAYRRAKELAPEQTWTDINLSGMLVRMGRMDEVRSILDELLRRSKSRYVPPFHIAIVHHQLGDTEQTLAWLEKAYQVRDPKMPFLKGPRWKDLAAEPRFQEIYRGIGF